MISLARCRLYSLRETLPYRIVKLKHLPRSRHLSTSFCAKADGASPSSSRLGDVANTPTTSSETTNTPNNLHQKLSAPQLPYQLAFPSVSQSVTTPSSTTASAAPTRAHPPQVASEPAAYVSQTRASSHPSLLPPRYLPDSPDGKTCPLLENQTPKTSKSKSSDVARQLPGPSRPAPVIPVNASLFPRVSLAPDSFSKIPPRTWAQRPGARQKTYNPFAPMRLSKERVDRDLSGAPPPILYRNPNFNAIQEIRNREKYMLPPVPAPRSSPLL